VAPKTAAVVALETRAALAELAVQAGGLLTPESVPTRLVPKLYADVCRVREELDNRRVHREASIAGKRLAIERWYAEEADRERDASAQRDHLFELGAHVRLAECAFGGSPARRSGHLRYAAPRPARRAHAAFLFDA
jgi:hypothetical protein